MDLYPGSAYLGLAFPDLPYIVSNGVLPAECKAVLFGPPKKGKSILLNQLVVAVIHQRDFLGFKTKRQRILYANFEVSHKGWQKRLQKYCRAVQLPLTDDVILCADLKGVKLDTPKGQSDLEGAVAASNPGVLILDPWYKVLTGSVNSDDSVLMAMDYLDYIITTYKCAVLICAHARKTRLVNSGAIDLGSQELRGGMLTGWVDSILNLVPLDKDGLRAQLQFECRHADDAIIPINLMLDRNQAGFIVVP